MARDAHQVEPQPVADLVDQWVDRERNAAAQYDNKDLLDEDGIWSLHRLAAEIYTRGHDDGEIVADARNRAANVRKREDAKR